MIEEAITNKAYVLAEDAGVYDIWFPSVPREPGRYRAKVAADQTAGRLSQVHMVERRGAAPPVHMHHDADETLYVIDGEVSVFLGDERVEAERVRSCSCRRAPFIHGSSGLGRPRCC